MSKPEARAAGTRTTATTRIENGKPKFVYVIYIASATEKVWQVGSHYVVDKDGVPPFDKGIVLECDPPRRLSYTWHPQYEPFLHEPHSRVTFELVQLEGQVQLTVTHDEFDEGSKVFESISGGWPRVLSSLKSWLETGRGLAKSWS